MRADSEHTTEDDLQSELSDIYKISIEDSFDRAKVWIDLASELTRLGVLALSMRAPQQFHSCIYQAARICKSQAEDEIARSDHIVGVIERRQISGAANVE